MVIIKQFTQFESKLPVYKSTQNESKNEVEYFQQDGSSSGGDSGFDDESDAEGSDGDGAKK